MEGFINSRLSSASKTRPWWHLCLICKIEGAGTTRGLGGCDRGEGESKIFVNVLKSILNMSFLCISDANILYLKLLESYTTIKKEVGVSRTYMEMVTDKMEQM